MTSAVTAQLQFNGIDQVTVDPIIRTAQDKTKTYLVNMRLFDGVKGHSILSADLELSIEDAEKFLEHFKGCLDTLKGLRDKETTK